MQLTRSLAMEYIKQGIRINAVAPGGTTTALVAAVQIPDDMDGSLVQRYTGFRAMSDPDEIASAVAYVASEEAGSMHGAILSIDGGMTTG